MDIKTKITAGDIMITAVIVAAAVFLFIIPLLYGSEPAYVVITVQNGGTTRFSLYENRELTVSSNGITLLVVIENAQVYVKSSDCPDKVCVHTGRISRSGQSIICAPAGVVISVEGGGADADHIAG